jgi:hypothetical protein
VRHGAVEAGFFFTFAFISPSASAVINVGHVRLTDSPGGLALG